MKECLKRGGGGKGGGGKGGGGEGGGGREGGGGGREGERGKLRDSFPCRAQS